MSSETTTNMLSSEVLALWDTKGASQFFLKFCGSKVAAVRFLESMIDHIDPQILSGGKRRLDVDSSSTETSTPTKVMKASNSTTTLVKSGSERKWDEIADLYLKDEFDNEMLTMVVLTPNDIGLSAHLIGKHGSNVTEICSRSHCKVQFERADQVSPHASDRHVMIVGKLIDLVPAYQLLQIKMDEKMADIATGYQSGIAKIVIPNESVAHIIGKAGSTVKKIQSDSGARVQIQHEEEMSMNNVCYGRTVIVTGTMRQRSHAIYLTLRQVLSFRFVPPAWKGSWLDPITTQLSPMMSAPAIPSNSMFSNNNNTNNNNNTMLPMERRSMNMNTNKVGIIDNSSYSLMNNTSSNSNNTTYHHMQQQQQPYQHQQQQSGMHMMGQGPTMSPMSHYGAPPPNNPPPRGAPLSMPMSAPSARTTQPQGRGMGMGMSTSMNQQGRGRGAYGLPASQQQQPPAK
eukprot:gene11616-24320_t